MKIGLGFLDILTLIFIVLKLTGVIAWSWWWVLSPILIPGGIAVAAVLIMLICYAVVCIFEKMRAKK